MPVRPLPTLLGLLVLLVGILALTNVPKPPLRPPPVVKLEPLPQTAFKAFLLHDTGQEVRTREVSLQAAGTPAARLEASLSALRTWLLSVGEGGWPAELGAPQVFWLEPGRAALDFPLRGRPDLSVATELSVLDSVRRTAARQGVSDIFILINSETPPTFLGQVALPQVLEAP